MATEEKYEFFKAVLPTGEAFEVGKAMYGDEDHGLVTSVATAPSRLPGFYVLDVEYEDGAARHFFISPASTVFEARIITVEAPTELVVPRAPQIVVPGQE